MKLNYKFLIVALATFGSLAGCAESEVIVPDPTYQLETNEALIQASKIEHVDDGVYGNIYLPQEVNGQKVQWVSSHPNIINVNGTDKIAPGIVTRRKRDVQVRLTAVYGTDETNYTQYTQTLTVKAAPKKIQDKDYRAYLFGHFVGESYTKGEQIYFALADVDQGLHFKDMNKSTMSSLKPVLSSKIGEKGVRDPYICRSPEGDTFYLIATDLSVNTRGGWNNNANQATKTGSHSITLWESHDLVNWTDARLIEVARKDAGMAWAPEMIYCEETGEYLIFFSSTILDEESAELAYSKRANAKIIYRDSVYFTATRDFVHFSETKQFIPNVAYDAKTTSRNERDEYALNNDFRKVIDGSVMKIGDWYYSACKDGGNNEDGGGIRIQKTQNLYDGKWEFVQNLADVGYKVESRNADNKCLEGPEWFYLNQRDRKDPKVPEIGLMADFYANTSIGYIPFATTNVEDIKNANKSWRLLKSGTKKDFSWDKQTKRHGTILRITAEEAVRLKKAYKML